MFRQAGDWDVKFGWMIKHAAQKSFFGSLHQLAFAATVYHLCVGEQPNIGHGAQGHAWIIAG